MKKTFLFVTTLIICATSFAQTVIKYDFNKDLVTTDESSTPANNANVASPNNATAGIVSYMDAGNVTSNMLKGYSFGQRNRTGVIDLSLFPQKSKDYSVTWKQCIGTPEKDYKVGVLLRGANPSGDESVGYAPGMSQGYLFIAYNAGGKSTPTPHSEFRIYKSTLEEPSLKLLINKSLKSLVPASSQPVWYRASVIDNRLSLEYSTDNVNWNPGASFTDDENSFSTGATQFVWGLGSNGLDFYVDDITYNLLKK